MSRSSCRAVGPATLRRMNFLLLPRPFNGRATISRPPRKGNLWESRLELVGDQVSYGYNTESQRWYENPQRLLADPVHFACVRLRGIPRRRHRAMVRDA